MAVDEEADFKKADRLRPLTAIHLGVISPSVLASRCPAASVVIIESSSSWGVGRLGRHSVVEKERLGMVEAGVSPCDDMAAESTRRCEGVGAEAGNGQDAEASIVAMAVVPLSPFSIL